MQQANVAFLGPLGTHSHEAGLRRFGPRFIARPCRTLREVFEALPGVDAALVPVENSLEGPVTQTLDLLAQRTAVLVREAFIFPIHNHLAVNPRVSGLNAVAVVYSHPQVLGQCEEWLHRNLPHADLVPMASTSEAARRAASERQAAAISSQVAADINKLRILARNIQDAAANATRFLLLKPPHEPHVVIKPPQTPKRPRMRTLLHLILHDRPGALLNALEPFNRHGVNLSFIQSRPLPGRAWEYGFFVEVDAVGTAPALRKTLKALAEHTQVCRVISSYPCYEFGTRQARRV